MAFLKAVGRQRMLTTDPEDLMEDKDNDLFNLIEQNSILNNSDDENPLINISSVVKLDQSNYSNLKNSDYRKKTKGKRYPWNATKQYPIKDKFIVIPFSQLYYIWCIILFSSIIYNLFIIPFTIAFEYNFDPFMYPIDIISLLIFVVDIFFASKTAFNKNYEITTNLEEVSKDYIESRLFFDVISIIPLDYILLIFISNQQFIAFWRIIRLFKFYKILW